MTRPHTELASSLCSLLLEEAHAQQQRLSTVKNKLVKKRERENVIFELKPDGLVKACLVWEKTTGIRSRKTSTC